MLQHRLPTLGGTGSSSSVVRAQHVHIHAGQQLRFHGSQLPRPYVRKAQCRQQAPSSSHPPFAHISRLAICRSALLPEPIPADVQLELNPDTTAKDVTYDEKNKVVRIPLSAAADGQRRTKLVMFTCNQCGGRSARLVNPVAWERGAVFCQCQHCGVWHTLAANKSIIEEIRYNDPEWQLEQPQSERTPAATAAADGRSGESLSGSSSEGDSMQSTGTVLGGSEEEQEATSAGAEQQQQQQSLQ